MSLPVLICSVYLVSNLFTGVSKFEVVIFSRGTAHELMLLEKMFHRGMLYSFYNV